MATGLLNPSTTSFCFLAQPLRPSLSPSARHIMIPNLSKRRSRWLAVHTARRNSTTKGLCVRCGAASIDQNTFEAEVLQSECPVLVEFVADWCGPCRLMAPALDSAAEEYKDALRVVKIEHDANPKLVEEYKVYGLPTLILFKNGQEVPESRREGAMTKVKLKEYLDSLLQSISVS